MRTNKLWAVLVAGVAVWFGFTSQPAVAHVLLKDSSGTYGAVLHVTPDDDPIAGRKASIYFDVQLPDSKAFTYEVSILANSTSTTVPVETTGSVVTATYTFAERGRYELHLQATPRDGSRSVVFKHTQHVSRGVVAGDSYQAPFWAEAGLLLSASAVVLLAMMAYNRKRRIMLYSRFKK